jgi:hypothetical protein
MQDTLRYPVGSSSTGQLDFENFGSETASEENIVFEEASFHTLQPNVWVLRSCISSSAICFTTFVLGLGELVGLWGFAHPLFWFPLSIGSLGVAGSTYISLRQLWIS